MNQEKKISKKDLENVVGGLEGDLVIEKPAYCKKCGTRFYKSDPNVERHYKDNTSIQEYKCPSCGTWN